MIRSPLTDRRRGPAAPGTGQEAAKLFQGGT
jgi:hypothetical protein